LLPLVYIIVLNWNGKDDTLECLRSLQNIDYKNYKILVVDNASEDGSVGAIQSEFPNIEILVNANNLRFAGGNNVGIKYGLQHDADYILLLNNDTAVDGRFLSSLIHCINETKDAGIAGAKIFYFFDKRRIWYAGGNLNFATGSFKHRGIRQRESELYNAVEEVDYITGCCMLIKREVIERVGMLDESYFIYGEDADYCLRAKNAGYKLMYIPSAIVYHKVSVSSGGNFSWFKNWNKLKSNLRLLWRYAKWYNWIVIPFTFPVGIIVGYYTAKRESKEIGK